MNKNGSKKQSHQKEHSNYPERPNTERSFHYFCFKLTRLSKDLGGGNKLLLYSMKL